MRILYTKLKLGKIYIQKRDGEGLVAFMVDEDQESYTFRKDLYKPAEFVLNRSDVLFISEKNPSGLKVDGEIGTDRVSLVWLPPYDDVKKYNIYMTKNKNGKYEVIDSVRGKSVTLKNLTSNTTYFFVVTSVDRDDYESSPSNELKITTKNILPEKPDGIKFEDTGSGSKKITWEASSDPDGKVEKYRIYGVVDGKRELISEVKKTEYVLKKASSYDDIEIAAVDDRDGESADMKIRKYAFIGFHPGVIFPLGKFGEMYGPGYGGEISLTGRNLLFENFEGGISLGFYSLQGKDLLDKKNKDYDRMMFAPAYLTAGYNLGLSYRFSIKPVLSFGGAYIDMKYYDRNKVVENEDDQHLRKFEAAFKAGLTAEYRLTDTLSFSAGCEYGAVVEKSGLLSFIVGNACIAYYF